MMWPFKWKLSACTFTWYYLFVKSLENEIWKFGRNLPLATFGSERVNKSDFCSLSCSIGFKTDGPNQGNWRKRFHLSVSPACQTSLITEPIQITGNKANECLVQRWKVANRQLSVKSNRVPKFHLDQFTIRPFGPSRLPYSRASYRYQPYWVCSILFNRTRY